MSLVCELPSVAMSASPLKLPPSNVTCRYWATSGTCFFGDQCNFAHDSADRATSEKSAVPKHEKACKELLLTGYCKSEKSGCEYNHDISGVNPSRPPSSSTAAASVPSPVAFSSRAPPTSPGTSAAIRSNRLPVSAPSFVPAAVAAAQRASLSAWGGVTPGSGKLITSGISSQVLSSSTLSMQDGQLNASSCQTSVVETPTTSAVATQSQDTEDSQLVDTILGDTFVSTTLTSTIDIPVLNVQSLIPNLPIPSSVALDAGPVPTTSGSTQGPSIGGANAMPFLPSGGSVAAAVSAAPFVPKSKQNLLSGGTSSGGVSGGMGRAQSLAAGQSSIGIGIGPLPQQISQVRQQLQQQMHQVAAQVQAQVHAQAQAQAQAQAHAHAQQAQAHAQAQAQIFAAARNMGGTVLSSNYMTMEGPMVIPTFRLPDGDDPALGMTAMSPPNATFLARASSGIAALTSPERITSMGNIVREMPDAMGAMQLGGSSSPFAHNFSGSLPSPSSIRAQQQYEHMLKMQLQQQNLQQQAFSSQSPPYALRSSQKTGPRTPEKQQLKPQAEYQVLTGQLSPYSIRLSQSLGAQTHEKLQLLSSQAEVAAKLEGQMSLATSLGPSTDRQGHDSDQSSIQASEAGIPLQSPQQQAGHSESPQQQQPSTPVSQSMLKRHQHHQQQLQALHQQQLRQKIQQQQQQQQQNMLQQQMMAQGQRSLSGPGQTQHRLPTTIRSSSPVSGVAPVAAATHGGATYFLGPGQGISSLPHAFNSSGGRNESRIVRGQFPAGTAPLGSRFLPDQLREELRRRHAMVHAQLDPEQDIVDLPEMVKQFHSLYPLEDMNRDDEIPSSAFGVRTMIFKGISSSDGQAYAIRRIDSRQVIASEDLAATAIEAVERWAPLARHPHIVAIRESFVSREVEDTAALFFVHDFHPGAVTLQRMHLQQEQAGGVVHLNVTEEQLWSYMVQLATVLRTVHGAGLFLRPGGLHPSKIIMASKGRLHISGVGILDVLHGDPADDPRKFQREDLAGFGRLILTIACGSAASASLEFMASHYSPDLVRITQALLASSPEKSEGHGISTIRQLYPSLAEHMFGEMENLHIQNDEVLNEMSKETENGRLLRILVKLGMMNERPENDMDPAWSETGDRYLLKLFRDFVFHQSLEDGTPMIDWGHVVECLNKLDAGVPERLILMSRDEQSLLIASYADLKRCLDNAYQELLARACGEETRLFLPQSIQMQAQARFNHRP